jgi:type VI secretion system secreted protein Hcp
LFAHCANGKHIPKAKLIVRKAGEKPLEYLTIDMEDLMITSVSTGGSGGEDKLTENVVLHFAKLKLTYKEQEKSGGGSGDVIQGWDASKNEKWG